MCGASCYASSPRRTIHQTIPGGTVNHDIIAGNWTQMKGKVRAKWGKLTDDDMTLIAGKKDMLVGKLQERYGHAKDRAEKDVDDFYENMDDGDRDTTDARKDAR
jgi:uncharacterized protein YjbJ (UPF0337 family)